MNTEFSISPDITDAMALIRQAINIGVLPSSKDGNVDLIVNHEGEERWESWPLLDAAVDLVNSGEIGMLKQTITEALAMIPEPA